MLSLRRLLPSLLLLLSACATARQPVPPGVIPERPPLTTAEEQYGHQVLSTLNEKYELEFNHPRYDEVVDTVDQLTAAVGADKDPWHVYMFKADKVKNAAATRGNHVFVWTGILSVAQTKEELATILSHEIAHVLAGHTDPDPNEEAKKLLVNLGAIAVGIAVTQSVSGPYAAQNLGNLSASLTQQVGSGILVFPYSRELELEADRIGLMIMGQAGMNPERAIAFWEKVQQDPDFSTSSEFFSSHPLAADRLEKLRQALPEAMARYRGEKRGEKGIVSQIKPRKSYSNAVPSIHTAPTKATTAEETWEVVSPAAVLFSSPTEKAKRIGELKSGALVRVISRRRGWLQISEPDDGYLKGVDLQPLASPK